MFITTAPTSAKMAEPTTATTNTNAAENTTASKQYLKLAGLILGLSTILLLMLLSFVTPLQILVGALSYLTPVMLGGGPKASRATNLVMDRAAAYRVTAANSCLLLALTPALP